MLLLALLSCEGPGFVPACLDEGALHSCGPALSRVCNQMHYFYGVTLAFGQQAPADYTVLIRLDGEELRFQCEDGRAIGPDGHPPVTCGDDGVLVEKVGDELHLELSAPGYEPVALDTELCWRVDEPNGRCCGYRYLSTVDVPLQGSDPGE